MRLDLQGVGTRLGLADLELAIKAKLALGWLLLLVTPCALPFPAELKQAQTLMAALG